MDMSHTGARWTTRFFRKWRWRLCCAGVAGLTYAAIYFALRLPTELVAVNFVMTAFPAAILQFIVIDAARHGFSVGGRKHAKPPW